jgi:hypothetical protein
MPLYAGPPLFGMPSHRPAGVRNMYRPWLSTPFGLGESGDLKKPSPFAAVWWQVCPHTNFPSSLWCTLLVVKAHSLVPCCPEYTTRYTSRVLPCRITSTTLHTARDPTFTLSLCLQSTSISGGGEKIHWSSSRLQNNNA